MSSVQIAVSSMCRAAVRTPCSTCVVGVLVWASSHSLPLPATSRPLLSQLLRRRGSLRRRRRCKSHLYERICGQQHFAGLAYNHRHERSPNRDVGASGPKRCAGGLEKQTPAAGVPSQYQGSTAAAAAGECTMRDGSRWWWWWGDFWPREGGERDRGKQAEDACVIRGEASGRVREELEQCKKTPQ